MRSILHLSCTKYNVKIMQNNRWGANCWHQRRSRTFLPIVFAPHVHFLGTFWACLTATHDSLPLQIPSFKALMPIY